MQKNEIKLKQPQRISTDEKEKIFENIDPIELAKIQFLNKVSHELRTPLSVIKMQIEAIEDGMYENNDQAFQKLKEKFSEFEALMDEMMKTK